MDRICNLCLIIRLDKETDVSSPYATSIGIRFWSSNGRRSSRSSRQWLFDGDSSFAKMLACQGSSTVAVSTTTKTCSFALSGRRRARISSAWSFATPNERQGLPWRGIERRFSTSISTHRVPTYLFLWTEKPVSLSSVTVIARSESPESLSSAVWCG